MNVLILTLALVGTDPTDYGMQYRSYLSAGWIETTSAPDADIHITALGCSPHEWAPWLRVGDEVSGGMYGAMIVGLHHHRPGQMIGSICTAVYKVQGPTWGKYIRVRATLPDGRTVRFLFKPIGSYVRCSVLYPVPRSPLP